MVTPYLLIVKPRIDRSQVLISCAILHQILRSIFLIHCIFETNQEFYFSLIFCYGPYVSQAYHLPSVYCNTHITGFPASILDFPHIIFQLNTAMLNKKWC